MSITVSCICGKSFKARDELAGRTGKCPSCGAALTIPEQGDATSTAKARPGAAAAKTRSAGLDAALNIGPDPLAGFAPGQQSPLMGMQYGAGSPLGSNRSPAAAAPSRTGGGGNKILLLGGILCGALLLVGIVSVAVVMLTGDENPKPVAAASNNAGSGSNSAGTAKKSSTTGGKYKFTVSKETTHIAQPLIADGEPDYVAALNAHFSGGVTVENNANVLLWKAHGPHPENATMPAEFFQLLGLTDLPEQGDYLLTFSKYLADHKQVPAGSPRLKALLDEMQQASSKSWNVAEHPDVAGWISANEKPLAQAVEASRRTRYYSPVVISRQPGEDYGLLGVLLPGVQQSREIARALTARAMLRLAEGKTNEAWNDLIACHRLGRLVGQGPFLIEKLVGIAMEGMAVYGELAFIDQVRPAADLTARCRQDLDALPPIPDMAESIDIGERYIFLDTTLGVARDGWKHVGLLADLEGQAAQYVSALDGASVDWDVVLRMGNQWYDRMADAMREPQRADRVRKIAAIDESLKQLGRDAKAGRGAIAGAGSDNQARSKAIGQILISLLLPAAGAAQNAEDRTYQQQTNLHLALALAAYHKAQNRYPAQLAELAPKYLKEIPLDIFSAHAIVYTATDGGYLLYSVGPNGQDDQGRTYGENPPGDDFRVRMPMEK